MSKRSYAILFSRITITEDTFLLLPLRIMEGKIGQSLVFEEKFNQNFVSLSEPLGLDMSSCYGFPIGEEKLMERFVDYIEMVDNESVASVYFDDIRKYMYFQELSKDGKVIYNYAVDVKKMTVSTIDMDNNFLEAYENVVFCDFKNNPVVKEELISIHSENCETANDPIVEKKNITIIDKTGKDKPQLDIASIYQEVTKNVICQDEQVEEILTAIAKNYMSNDKRIKSNILVTGPTGVGKTEIIRNIASHINLPVVEADSTEYTIEGYIGSSISDMLERLLKAADGNVKAAERGILVVDEIDKKSADSGDKVATKGVLDSLLKTMEGKVTRVNFENKKIEFDTSKLTFIAMGAFSEIYENKNKQPLGFLDTNNEIKSKNMITSQEFFNYGMPPEFIGRFNTIVNMNSLGYNELKSILINSEISKLKINKKFLQELGVLLSYDDEVINEIAKKALELNVGARSLDNIIEYALKKATFEILKEEKRYQELKLVKETISNNKQYILR